MKHLSCLWCTPFSYSARGILQLCLEFAQLLFVVPEGKHQRSLVVVSNTCCPYHAG